ncbi:MAG: glutathione S-transferase family protein [Myxococcota bacterium]
MIRVHHLERSRSQRVLWLLEELGVDYEVVRHARDPVTQRAPDALRAVHPLGKSPVIVDGDVVLAESGAIVDYLVVRHGRGALAPHHDDADFPRYLYWLHFAEGSGMFPLLLDLFLGMAGDGAAPLRDAVGAEIDALLAFLERELEGREWLLGARFSAVDPLVSFVAEFASTRRDLAAHPNVRAWLERAHARPAYQRALARGA